VALGVSGCTAIDVVAYMKKMKQKIDSFEVLANVTMSEGKVPKVFTDIELLFQINGQFDKNIAIEAVKLSQTKYCGVTAMLLKATPVHYKVLINGEEVADGRAKFE